MVERVLEGKDISIFTGLSSDEANEFLDNHNKRWVRSVDTNCYRCPSCDGVVMQTTLYVSVHDIRFEGMCAGGGEVRRVNYSYCPNCDGEPKILRACVHC